MFRTLRWFGACTGLVLLVSLTVGLAAPAGVDAQESGGWTLAPTATPGVGEAARPYFLYSAKPGETLSDSVTLYNTSDQALRFRLYPSDAFNTKKGGGYALNTLEQVRASGRAELAYRGELVEAWRWPVDAPTAGTAEARAYVDAGIVAAPITTAPVATPKRRPKGK
jgi:hypothetical protein